MYKLFLIVSIFIAIIFPERNVWSSSPIEKFYNENFNKMIFKDPIYLIPYDIKIGILSYGGPGYIKSFLSGNQNIENNPIIMDNLDINDQFILESSNRNMFFLELDILKYNFAERIYHQNLLDFHLGTGFRFSKSLSNPVAPIYGENENKGFRFRPTIYDGFLSTSINYQFSPKFFFSSNYAFGISYGNIYESLAQKPLIPASGLNESLSLGFKYIINQESLPYDYIIGSELRFGRTYLNRINDFDNVTPILALDINSVSLNFTFGTLFGGNKTKGDNAYHMMMNGDYILAAEAFKGYLNIYNHKFRDDEAKKMLNFCYTQIPYQYFDIAVNYYLNDQLNEALINFEKAELIASPELILEIESYKRDIAIKIINEIDQNLNKVSFNESIKKLNITRKISPYLWSETDKVEAKILLKKGDILKTKRNYLYAIDYYKQAIELNPELITKINDKFNELIILIMNDINKTKNYNELHLVKDYLNYIIDLKPMYSKNYQLIIDEINDKVSLYKLAKNSIELSSYIQNKKNNDTLKNAVQITLGMSIHEIESILGHPKNIKNQENYELWIYNINGKSTQYFFEDFILVKIN